MGEPPTHYQVSFTSKQAFSLFVGLLAALGLAYFFGLMTGLSGSEAAPAAAVNAAAAPPGPAETPSETAEGKASEGLTFPAPVTAAPLAGEARPGPPKTIRAFEDREGPPAGAAPAPARAATARPAAVVRGFRVQVLSVSSRADADAEAGRLSKSGLPARVEAGTGPRGTVYRVRVGPFATREEAEQASRRLSSQGRRDTWIIPPAQ